MSTAQLDKWLTDVTTIGEATLGHKPCLAEHPTRRLVCDLPVGHVDGHACYPFHYKEPVFWAALRLEEDT
jgi:hypothetical protein